MASRIVVTAGSQLRGAEKGQLLRGLLRLGVDRLRERDGVVVIELPHHRLHIASALDVRRIVDERRDDDIGIESAPRQDSKGNQASGDPGFHWDFRNCTGEGYT